MTQPPGPPGPSGGYGPPVQPGPYPPPQPGPYVPPPRYPPPGSYGGPAPYAPPAGSYPGGYGPAGPGGPGGYGPGGYGGPPRRSPLPWIIAAAVAVVAVLGVVLFVVLRDQGNSRLAAQAGASSALPSLPTDATVPGGARPTGTVHPDTASAGRGRFSGSEQVALQWMQAMYQHDFATAYRVSCSSMQGLADQVGRQRGSSGPDVLGAAFFSDAVGGRAIQGGTLDSVAYDAGRGDDVASFTLQLGDGSTTTVRLLVDEKVTVCDWQ